MTDLSITPAHTSARNLDDLLIALYVRIDDEILKKKMGTPPKLTDAEIICLAIAQVLSQCATEARFHRLWLSRFGHLFPVRIDRSQYNRRVRGLAQEILFVLNLLVDEVGARDSFLRLLDSTPVPCGRSRATALRSDMAGVADYGFSAAHSRFYWGFRLYLHCNEDGWPLAFELANPKTGERIIALEVLDQNTQEGHLTFADRGFAGEEIEAAYAAGGAAFVFPPKGKRDPTISGIRLRIESVFWTLKNQLSLENHSALTIHGLITCVVQRLAALAVALWHNRNLGCPGRSLIAYDH